MIRRHTYNPEYRETAEIKDGRQVLLRMVRPEDRERLSRGFERLSPQSRYRRFFTSKSALSEDELRFFTETDGYDHFALGALLLNADGSEGEGIGIARFIRVNDGAGVAEVAITVIDEMQGLGVGRILLERLIEAASERDVSRLRFHLLAENDQVRALIRQVCDRVTYQDDEGMLTAEIALPPISAAMPGYSLEPLDRLFEILRLVASGSLEPQLIVTREIFDSTARLLSATGFGGIAENSTHPNASEIVKPKEQSEH